MSRRSFVRLLGRSIQSPTTNGRLPFGQRPGTLLKTSLVSIFLMVAQSRNSCIWALELNFLLLRCFWFQDYLCFHECCSHQGILDQERFHEKKMIIHKSRHVKKNHGLERQNVILKETVSLWNLVIGLVQEYALAYQSRSIMFYHDTESCLAARSEAHLNRKELHRAEKGCQDRKHG